MLVSVDLIISAKFTLISYMFYVQYTKAIMGYGPEDKNTVVELTYNYGVKEYDKGNGYAQVNC